MIVIQLLNTRKSYPLYIISKNLIADYEKKSDFFFFWYRKPTPYLQLPISPINKVKNFSFCLKNQKLTFKVISYFLIRKNFNSFFLLSTNFLFTFFWKINILHLWFLVYLNSSSYSLNYVFYFYKTKELKDNRPLLSNFNYL